MARRAPARGTWTAPQRRARASTRSASIQPSPTRRVTTSAWSTDEENFSQDALAGRLPRTESWLAKLETGEREITVFDVFLLADAMGLDPGDLLAPPTATEKARMATELKDVAADRARRGVTPEHIAEERAGARLRNRKSKRFRTSGGEGGRKPPPAKRSKP